MLTRSLCPITDTRYNIDSETSGCSTDQRNYTDKQMDEYDLEWELSLTAMIFCSSDYEAELAMTCSNEDETDMLAQRNMYFAGNLASKYSHYELK